MAVTPVRTGPFPISSLPSPEMSVVWPTSTPFTSVIALLAPGVPSNGTPRSRARGLLCAGRIAATMVRNIRTNVDRYTRLRHMGPPASRQYTGTNRDRGCAVWYGSKAATLRYNRSNDTFLGEMMDSWKKAVVLGSIGAAALLFMKKRYPAGVLATGVGLAVLASEYPDKFERVRQALPDYFE